MRGRTRCAASVEEGHDLVRHHGHVLFVVGSVLGEALLLVAVRAVHLVRGRGRGRGRTLRVRVRARVRVKTRVKVSGAPARW